MVFVTVKRNKYFFQCAAIINIAKAVDFFIIPRLMHKPCYIKYTTNMLGLQLIT